MAVSKKTFKVKPSEDSTKEVEGAQTLDEDIMNWKTEDKKTLLAGLELYGERNLRAISLMLPHIPPKAIKKTIAVYSALAEHMYEDKLIDNWLASGMCKRKVLTDAMYFISLLETHPNSTGSKEYNLRNVYNLIYKIFSNNAEPTKIIKTKELELLLLMLDNLDKAMGSKPMQELFHYLGQNYKRRHIQKVYKGRKASTL